MTQFPTIQKSTLLRDAEQVFNIGDDIILVENYIPLSLSTPFIFDMTIGYICIEGNSQGRINMLPFQIAAGDMLICTCGQIIEQTAVSPDFKGFALLLSTPFLNDLLISERVKMFLSVKTQPIIHLDQQELQSILIYRDMLKNMMRIKDNPTLLMAAKHLTIAYFYGLGYYIHSEVFKVQEPKSKEQRFYCDFIQLVQKHHCQEHQLDFYARKMGISVKHLSRMVKAASNQTPSDIINDYLILTAKALFSSTDMTIQQVSLELNFPSQSFFAKFFKHHTGLTPSDYKHHT